MNAARLFAALMLGAATLATPPALAADDDAPPARFGQRWSEMAPPGYDGPKRVRTITIRGADADADLDEIPDVTGTTNEAPSPTTGYFVQVAIQRTAAEALSSYRALQVKYSVVLGGREPDIRRVDAADKGAQFRAAVGPFENAGEAEVFCVRLKTGGGQCVVQQIERRN